MTTEPLYHSPWGLLPFQVEATTWALTRPSSMLVLSTGLGKTHCAMAAAAFSFEEHTVDNVVIVAEANKIHEWVEDFKRFTKLDVALYAGPKDRRRRILARDHQVLVATYETLRNDAASGDSKLTNGIFTTHFMGRRMLVVYDEISRLKNKSTVWKRHRHMLKQWRKRAWTQVVGLTATPIEKGPQDYYHICKAIAPWTMPTDEVFEHEYVATKDAFGNPKIFKNLGTGLRTEPDVIPFAERLVEVQFRKRKTDDDVKDQFPALVEESLQVDLSDDHYQLIKDAREILIPTSNSDGDEIEPTPEQERAAFNVLRILASNPASLLSTSGKLAAQVIEELGADRLRDIESEKMKEYVKYAELIASQDARMITFTFFAGTVLPDIYDALRAAGLSVVTYHGQMSQRDRLVARDAFKAGQGDILLASDVAARGMNLPEAMYVSHFELPVTYGLYDQRLNRAHRIDSKHSLVTSMAFISTGTVEVGIANLVLKRNGYADVILDGDTEDDSNHISAADRRELLQIGRT